MDMRRFGSIMVVFAAGLLTVATTVPVSAATSTGKAVGDVTWDGQSGERPGRTSEFRVIDGAPGQDSWAGDGGWYDFSEDGVGSLHMKVQCVKVEPGWAEFAGVITEATGPYSVGEVFLVSVKDSGRKGTRGDEIGMKYKASLGKGCAAALNDYQFGRKGIITGGNIRVRFPR